MTKRQFVSDVKNDLLALNVDQHISARFILSKAEDFVKDIISQRPLSSFLRDFDFVTQLTCFEMERVESIKCPIAEFRTCDNIMKSVKKLPKTVLSSMGYTILSVSNMIDDVADHIEYVRLDKPTDYSAAKKRRFGKHFAYFYVMDDYLYLLNTKNKLVNIVAVFEDDEEVKEASECEDCDTCASKLDSKFVCPEKYRARVKEATVTSLFNFYKRNIVDENPDMDSNQKSATVA